MTHESRGVDLIVVLFRSDINDVRNLISAFRDAAGAAGLMSNVIVAVNDGQNYAINADMTILSDANVGFAAAVRAAVREARFNSVLIANSDLTVESGDFAHFLTLSATSHQVLVPLILTDERTPDIAAYCNWTFSTLRFLNFRRTRAFIESDASILPSHVKSPGAFISMPTQLAIEYGPFDDAFFLYGEDRDFFRRATASGQVVQIVRDVAVVHKSGHSSSQVPQLVATSQLDAAVRIAFRRWGATGVLLAMADSVAIGVVRTLTLRPPHWRSRLEVARRWLGIGRGEAPRLSPDWLATRDQT